MVVWFLLAGLAGCGARPASRFHEEGLARNGLAPAEKGVGPSGNESANDDDMPPTIVIGFVGGFVRHTDLVHSPVRVAVRIRESYPSRVHVEVFENRRREEAHRKILEILGSTRNGKLSDSAKQQARVIIYGMSWGGSETVALARQLKGENIPVLLTVQVDSVGKVGENDEVIPSNVAEAANFYQTDGLLHGRTQIRAEDAARTKIVGNYHYEYKKKSPSCDEYPWYDRIFTKYHTKIECDPEVWSRVEALIRAKLPPAEKSATKGVRSKD